MLKNKDILVQEIKTCFLCGIEGLPFYAEMHDRLFDVQGVWSFLRCSQCGLVWLHPRPITEDMGGVYPSFYYTHNNQDKLLKQNSLRNSVKNLILSTAFSYSDLFGKYSPKKMIGRLLSLLFPLKEIVGASIMYMNGSRKGKLLDVGCGNGQFLAKMQNLGWEAMGIEPDVQAAQVAQKQFGVPVIMINLEKAGLPDNYFDVVTMNHVIEHLDDPINSLQECQRILKPRGKLILLSPNINSLGHKIFREFWLGIDPPRHFYLYSLQTLKACIEKVGFQIETLRTTERHAYWYWITSRLIGKNRKFNNASPRSIGCVLYLEGVLFQLTEHALLLFQRNIGEEIVLIASKR
jgi:2-polyprenyl-3-methyl-5-hydroxy-6-metoxy-1,4-benzoquinol methylase